MPHRDCMVMPLALPLHFGVEMFPTINLYLKELWWKRTNAKGPNINVFATLI
jgi:hypothetical protein